jgi:hypothetical protein
MFHSFLFTKYVQQNKYADIDGHNGRMNNSRIEQAGLEVALCIYIRNVLFEHLSRHRQS